MHLRLVLGPLVVASLIAGTAPIVQAEESDESEPGGKTIDMPLDLPALAEVDALDDENASIRRFFLTSQGMRGQTVPIDGTSGWFCTLSQSTHTMLDYWPDLDKWVFQIGFDEATEMAAGGLATCHRLPS